jgi:hypothetical protein
VELQVGVVEVGAGPEERAALADVGGQRPAPAQVVVGDVLEVLGVLERAAASAADERHGRVVLQALPDAGQVVHDVDADLAQVGRGADAREQEQLRAVDRAAAEQHLAVDPHRVAGPLAQVLDADRAAVLDEHPGGQRVRADLEVGAGERRAQEGRGGRPALARASG